MVCGLVCKERSENGFCCYRSVNLGWQQVKKKVDAAAGRLSRFRNVISQFALRLALRQNLLIL
jgi:hypothetical protein